MSNKWIKIFKIVGVLCLLSLLAFIIYTAKNRQEDVVCTKIIVQITDANTLKFVTEKDVLAMLNQSENSSIINQKVAQINLKQIEQKIEENAYIENAEVYVNFDGLLKIDVVQKKPLYRIINNNNVSYYISDKAEKVPLSSNFTPRLMVITGFVPNNVDFSTNKVHQNIAQLVEFIQADPFWNAMIGQVQVNKNGDFVLFPKLASHSVLLGSIDDVDGKLKKLKIFYKEALTKTDLNNYNQINLKYKGQLICSK